MVWESLAQSSIHGSIRKLKGAKHCTACIYIYIYIYIYIKEKKNEDMPWLCVTDLQFQPNKQKRKYL
jgi:hypothetical protein